VGGGDEALTQACDDLTQVAERQSDASFHAAGLARPIRCRGLGRWRSEDAPAGRDLDATGSGEGREEDFHHLNSLSIGRISDETTCH
jgi:hypothetical protein